MDKVAWLGVRAATALAITVLTTPPALAASPLSRAWISGAGVDTPGCGGVPTPCRSLQYTLDNVVQAGGVIETKDAANYGSATITHGITIIGSGMTAGVGVSSNGFSGVTVEAGPTDQVLLKGLTIDGGGVGADGVLIFSAGNVAIVGCTIRGFVQADVEAVQQQSGTSGLQIADSLLIGGFEAVDVEPGASGLDPYVPITIRNVRVEGGSSAGLNFDSSFDTVPPYAVISDTMINGATTGILDVNARVVVERTSVMGSTNYGVNLQGSGGFLVVTSSVIIGSGLADVANGGTAPLETARNNIFGPTAGSITNYTLN